MCIFLQRLIEATRSKFYMLGVKCGRWICIGIKVMASLYVCEMEWAVHLVWMAATIAFYDRWLSRPLVVSFDMSFGTSPQMISTCSVWETHFLKIESATWWSERGLLYLQLHCLCANVLERWHRLDCTRVGASFAVIDYFKKDELSYLGVSVVDFWYLRCFKNVFSDVFEGLCKCYNCKYNSSNDTIAIRLENFGLLK